MLRLKRIVCKPLIYQLGLAGSKRRNALKWMVYVCFILCYHISSFTPEYYTYRQGVSLPI